MDVLSGSGGIFQISSISCHDWKFIFLILADNLYLGPGPQVYLSGDNKINFNPKKLKKTENNFTANQFDILYVISRIWFHGKCCVMVQNFVINHMKCDVLANIFISLTDYAGHCSKIVGIEIFHIADNMVFHEIFQKRHKCQYDALML